ncbi:uncharacterized protein ASCRUDRAFT_68038 [Ascoidea rubescens DSM 1968]|uniref:Uncharacterized protein n=1 Tax=Ascoidea rubescens DSM 1968 TaxID=1344418 RepID=A0A1D2VQV8_9ASCO|nr:hypothetical protein ASCRUDRAFT_68038 [Ascoidea rubescens DSM 1968]ODV63991.1 hypothetical protein ASCRUDRAFT_68038 [Ascoidea rubescens DSM 1968]
MSPSKWQQNQTIFQRSSDRHIARIALAAFARLGIELAAQRRFCVHNADTVLNVHSHVCAGQSQRVRAARMVPGLWNAARPTGLSRVALASGDRRGNAPGSSAWDVALMWSRPAQTGPPISVYNPGQ